MRPTRNFTRSRTTTSYERSSAPAIRRTSSMVTATSARLRLVTGDPTAQTWNARRRLHEIPLRRGDGHRAGCGCAASTSWVPTPRPCWHAPAPTPSCASPSGTSSPTATRSTCSGSTRTSPLPDAQSGSPSTTCTRRRSRRVATLVDRARPSPPVGRRSGRALRCRHRACRHHRGGRADRPRRRPRPRARPRARTPTDGRSRGGRAARLHRSLSERTGSANRSRTTSSHSSVVSRSDSTSMRSSCPWNRRPKSAGSRSGLNSPAPYDDRTHLAVDPRVGEADARAAGSAAPWGTAWRCERVERVPQRRVGAADRRRVVHHDLDLDPVVQVAERGAQVRVDVVVALAGQGAHVDADVDAVGDDVGLHPRRRRRRPGRSCCTRTSCACTRAGARRARARAARRGTRRSASASSSAALASSSTPSVSTSVRHSSWKRGAGRYVADALHDRSCGHQRVVRP